MTATNDVLQYCFGGYLAVPDDGLDDERRRVRRCSASTTRSRVSRGASTAPTAPNNQADTSSFIATSGILPPDQFKQFESWPSAR